MHADDGAPFVNARVRLGGTHIFTDETGTYRFVSPPVLGDQVLLIDGSTNNSPQFEYPSGIAMPVMIVAGQDNRVLTSYIGRVDATRFTNEEMTTWGRNIDRISELGRIRTEQCIRLYSGDRCKLQECIDEASRDTREAMKQEDLRHNRKMEELLTPSAGRQAGGIVDEVCNLI